MCSHVPSWIFSRFVSFCWSVGILSLTGAAEGRAGKGGASQGGADDGGVDEGMAVKCPTGKLVTLFKWHATTMENIPKAARSETEQIILF